MPRAANVAIGPGLNALTRIERGPKSNANCRTQASNAALAGPMPWYFGTTYILFISYFFQIIPTCFSYLCRANVRQRGNTTSRNHIREKVLTDG